MNQEQQLIIETTRRIFTDLCTKEVVDAAEQGQWPRNLWQTLEESGMTLAGIPGIAGGSDGSMADSLLVIRQAASFAAPLPLAETFIAATLLVQAGQKCPPGVITVASGNLTFKPEATGVYITGMINDVAFARQSEHVLLVSHGSVCLVPAEALPLETNRSLSGEDRSLADLNQLITGVEEYALPDAAKEALHLGARTRVNMMSGAMTSILDLSVGFALERVQFGRPISRFQAIQQQLAILAGEVAACQRAADSVLDNPTPFDIAVAKARVGEAVTNVANISHQVHGAMGYTMEHPLNLRTRRLWDWRDEYGNETFWQTQLGEAICQTGADNLWSMITDAA
ncbi:MAG: acyl-CoA dehydrogenase family protein [bacterium]